MFVGVLSMDLSCITTFNQRMFYQYLESGMHQAARVDDILGELKARRKGEGQKLNGGAKSVLHDDKCGNWKRRYEHPPHLSVSWGVESHNGTYCHIIVIHPAKNVKHYVIQPSNVDCLHMVFGGLNHKMAPQVSSIWRLLAKASQSEGFCTRVKCRPFDVCIFGCFQR